MYAKNNVLFTIRVLYKIKQLTAQINSRPFWNSSQFRITAAMSFTITKQTWA